MLWQARRGRVDQSASLSNLLNPKTGPGLKELGPYTISCYIPNKVHGPSAPWVFWSSRGIRSVRRAWNLEVDQANEHGT